MTTFIVNGQQVKLEYIVNGVDISADFIGNTAHGMKHDDDGNYIASQDDLDWWRGTIAAYKRMSAIVDLYKRFFDQDEVDDVVRDWTGDDMETGPDQVIMGLEINFGPLSGTDAGVSVMGSKGKY